MLRHGFPFLERRIPDRLGFLPLLHAFRPTDLRPLVARFSYRVIRDCAEPAFLLCEAKDMIVNPVPQTERQGSGLSCFGWKRLLGFKKSLATVVENFRQPIRNAVFDFQDRADPQVELLPADVFIADFVEPLPGYAASLFVGTFAGGPLKSGGRVVRGFELGFLQIGAPRRGRRAACPPTLGSEPAADLF